MDKNEFISLVLPLKDRLFRVAWCILRSKEEAEDIVQDVMLKVWLSHFLDFHKWVLQILCTFVKIAVFLTFASQVKTLPFRLLHAHTSNRLRPTGYSRCPPLPQSFFLLMSHPSKNTRSVLPYAPAYTARNRNKARRPHARSSSPNCCTRHTPAGCSLPACRNGSDPSHRPSR